MFYQQQSTNYQSNSSKASTKYFNFPQEIIFAQLNSYKLKIQQGNKIELTAQERGQKKSICFVKLYLFEQSFIEPLS